MQILVFGATEVGYMVASRLYQEHDITIIDDRPPSEKFNALDITFVTGSGADIETLNKAGAASADYFVACSRLDEANIVACWTVKKLADMETICFISKEEIYTNLIPSTNNRYQTRYDIDTIIWPEQLLTQDIFRIMMVPEAIDVEYFDDGKARLFEYPIKEDSPLADVLIKNAPLPKNVLIVGLSRENQLIIPNGEMQIKSGDRAIFMGTQAALDMLAANIFPNRNRIRTATIIGGGNVGYFLAQKMERSKIRVTIIENKSNRCAFLADNLKSSLVLNADGTDISVLEEESIGDMDIVICVTNNDEKNLLCSLLVKQLGTPRVITRVEHIQNALLFEKVGIDVVVSPWNSALKELYNHFRAKDVDVLALVERGMAEVVRVAVPAHFPETRVMDLKLPSSTIIGMISRRRKYIIPAGRTTILPGDKLKVFTMSETKDKITSIFDQ